MTALYLCYQSILEPLTHTQVAAYLEGLSKGGYRIVLLTFEPRPLTPVVVKDCRERLAAKGVIWHWCHYHKRPTVPATAWDILRGILTGFRLVKNYKVRLLHARSHVPAVMGFVLKRLTGAKLLFDLRGFMAEEYTDAGIWPANGLLFRITKWVERKLLQNADAIVVLTEKAKDLLHQWYPREVLRKSIQVIPCCVDLRHVPGKVQDQAIGPGKEDEKVLAYVGKLGGWYLTEEMLAFFAAAAQIIPHLRCQIWTQSDTTTLHRYVASRGLEQEVTIGRVSAMEVPAVLAKAHAGLSFIKPCLSKLASSPTKVGEYLAVGLPVVASAGIGDLDALLTGQGGQELTPVGVLVSNFTPPGYRQAVLQLLPLLDDPATPVRCQAAAKEHLDLEQVGWARYRFVYKGLIDD